MTILTTHLNKKPCGADPFIALGGYLECHIQFHGGELLGKVHGVQSVCKVSLGVNGEANSLQV